MRSYVHGQTDKMKTKTQIVPAKRQTQSHEVRKRKREKWPTSRQQQQPHSMTKRLNEWTNERNST